MVFSMLDSVRTTKEVKQQQYDKIPTHTFIYKWGVLTPKKQKKTSRYTKIGKLALGFFFGFFWFFFFFYFLKFPNWHWFFFFGFFFGFFGLGFGQHSKLETGFWVFWFFLGFFVFFGIFWHLILGLVCHPKKNQKKKQKIPKKPKKKTNKPKKKPKKTVATPKLVNWLGFFGFFFVFWGEHPP